MPTLEVLAAFLRDWERLTPQQQRAFRQAVAQFIADLADGGHGFRPSLRVKRLRGHPRVWEMTWAPDDRATFEYGERDRLQFIQCSRDGGRLKPAALGPLS